MEIKIRDQKSTLIGLVKGDLAEKLYLDIKNKTFENTKLTYYNPNRESYRVNEGYQVGVSNKQTEITIYLWENSIIIVDFSRK